MSNSTRNIYNERTNRIAALEKELAAAQKARVAEVNAHTETLREVNELRQAVDEAQQFKETWREGCNEDLQKENDRLRELLAVVKERRETLRDAVREFLSKPDNHANFTERDKLVSLVED